MLSKVKPGDALVISAEAYNAFVDAALAHRQGRNSPPVNARGGIAPQTGIVHVRNDSGADVDRCAILGINGLAIDPFDLDCPFADGIALAGVTPAADTHEGRFVITLEPIASGKYGRAVVAGVTACKVNIADSSHDADAYAEIADAQSGYLESSADGGSAEILHKAAGTGQVWAIVRMGAGASALPAGVGEEKVYAFPFHYTGLSPVGTSPGDDTFVAVGSIPDCLICMFSWQGQLRECTSGATGLHPKYKTVLEDMTTPGQLDRTHWVFGTGFDWSYAWGYITAIDQDGAAWTIDGDLEPQIRIDDATGAMEIRIRRIAAGVAIRRNLVGVIAVKVIRFGPLPPIAELGADDNCCNCHETKVAPAAWGDGQWSGNPPA